MIHLVRHGQTSANRDGLLVGRIDPPLTDLGMLKVVSGADAEANPRSETIPKDPR